MHNSTIILEKVEKKELAKFSDDLAYISGLQIDQEKWNPGKSDIFVFIESEQVFFYLIKRKLEASRAKTIGSISIFTDGHFVTIGSFFVDAAFRSQGIGQYVFSKVLVAHRVTFGALLSQPGREAFYERNGFRVECFFSQITLEIKKSSALNMPLEKITPPEIKKLVSFDKRYTGIDRKGLLECLIAKPEHVTCVSFSKDYSPTGYGLLRPLQRGYRASVYALSPQYFEEIFGKIVKHLLSLAVHGQVINIIMDCPTIKEPGLLASQGFLPSGRYALMFKGTENLPLGLSGEFTWGLLTEECG